MPFFSVAARARKPHVGLAMRHKIIVLLAFLATSCTNPNPAADPVTSSATQPLAGVFASVTLAAGDTNDVAIYPFPDVVFVHPNAAGSTMTGIRADAPLYEDNTCCNGPGVSVGTVFDVQNAGTGMLTLGNNRAADPAYDGSIASRILCPDGKDVTLPPGRSARVVYGDDYEWHVITSSFQPQVTNTAPSHTLGTAWQVGAQPTLGHYSVRISSTLTLTGGQAGRVELAIGPTSGSQTTVCGRVAGASTGTAVVGLADTDIAEGELSCMIPPGWWGILRSTDETGTPTYTITNQLEQQL